MEVTEGGVLMNEVCTVVGQFHQHKGQVLLRFVHGATLTRDDIEELPGMFIGMAMATGLSSRGETNNG